MTTHSERCDCLLCCRDRLLRRNSETLIEWQKRLTEVPDAVKR